MKRMEWTAPRVRCVVAGLAAVFGGVVAGVMQVSGGSLSRFLPGDISFYGAAGPGAAIAGAMCADGVGRRGVGGVVAVGVTGMIMTVVGAVIGAQTIYGAAGWGLLAVLDAATSSLAVIIVWLGGLACVHLAARRSRNAYAQVMGAQASPP